MGVASVSLFPPFLSLGDICWVFDVVIYGDLQETEMPLRQFQSCFSFTILDKIYNNASVCG